MFLERKGLSKRSINDYLFYYNKIKNPDEFTQDNIDSLIDSYPNNPVVRATISNFKSFLIRQGYNVYNIEIPRVTGRKEKRLPKVLSVDDLEKIYKICRSDRDKLLLLVSFYCGLRISELMGIKIHSFNWDEWLKNVEKAGKLSVIGKGNKERIVFVPNWLMQKLKDYIETTKYIPEGKNIWHCNKSRWNKLLNEYSQKGLGRKVNPHLLRHSCATYLLDKGMELQEIRDYLGHQSIATTQIYTHLSMKNLEMKYSQIAVD